MSNMGTGRIGVTVGREYGRLAGGSLGAAPRDGVRGLDGAWADTVGREGADRMRLELALIEAHARAAYKQSARDTPGREGLRLIADFAALFGRLFTAPVL